LRVLAPCPYLNDAEKKGREVGKKEKVWRVGGNLDRKARSGGGDARWKNQKEIGSRPLTPFSTKEKKLREVRGGEKGSVCALVPHYFFRPSGGAKREETGKGEKGKRAGCPLPARHSDVQKESGGGKREDNVFEHDAHPRMDRPQEGKEKSEKERKGKKKKKRGKRSSFTRRRGGGQFLLDLQKSDRTEKHYIGRKVVYLFQRKKKKKIFKRKKKRKSRGGRKG